MPQFTFSRARLRTWGIPAATLVAGAGIGVGAMALWGPAGSDTTEAIGRGAMAGDGTETLTVALQTLEDTVDAQGTLAAVTSSALAFQASGEVTAVNVDEGDTVAVGDVIAEIDTLALTASLRAAEADLAQAEASLSNLEDEADGSDSSDAQIEAAEAQVDVLKASVDDAEDAMSDAQLVADISGLITSQPYEVGDVVSSGSSSGGADVSMGGTATAASTTATAASGVTIVGQDQWTVSVSLSEADVADIAEGDQVTFTADDLADPFFGVVTDIANLPTTTGGSATYAVELTVTGTVEGLYEGTSVDASIVTLRETDVLAVPANAITTTDGVSTVTVVGEDDVTETREVTTGETIGAYTEITDGLTEGEQLEVTVMASTGTTDGDGAAAGFGGQFRGGELPEGTTFPGGEMPTGQAPGQ
ncbi:efflux RND transporter periplasmic adaptor subunit [Demequina sp. NBRC 110055]|uniref:efflux RND transporter periplasmic adaptor subunit n=1 Tax=Demequina sp. NBRC 110055 TaxID=1570344 RepID=UPI000A02ED44|nr:biotin/lipoyl-binding protein [Demequina sp. NBRC 110055]